MSPQAFDGDDRVSVQDAIAGRVIEAIAPHLSRDIQRLASPGTADGLAYEAYLNGRAHVSRPNRSDLRKAVEHFRFAVARDQRVADAWAGLAVALRMLPVAGDERPINTFPAAKAAADRALKPEPEHPDALAAHGIPPHHLALVLHALTRDDEALERLREAVAARDWFVTFQGADPKWDELRSTPAFDALLSRSNLLDVSRAVESAAASSRVEVKSP